MGLICKVASGKSIQPLNIRQKTGATVAGILRNGKLYSNLSPEFIFQKEDMAGVLGTTEQQSMSWSARV
ncbi:MAG: hypothetical protein GY699_19395 [Desulfobacteraceae bacterium]|nr:hypothetical protein [Desulfobacteraceae bacterium]